MTGLSAVPGLPPATIALMALMTFVAASIRGLTGFGMAIVLVPLLGMVVRPEEGVVLAILLQFLIGPVGITTIVSDCEKPSSPVMALCAMLTTPLGLWLLAQTSPDVARILIAGVAIGAFLLLIWPNRWEKAPSWPVTLAAGVSAGVLTGFAGMPGPPVVPYYLRPGVTPVVARASMMLVFFATAIAGTLVSFLLGLATGKLALIALILLVPMLVGNWLGAKAFGKVPPALWRSAAALLLGMAGLSAVWRAIN